MRLPVWAAVVAGLVIAAAYFALVGTVAGDVAYGVVGGGAAAACAIAARRHRTPAAWWALAAGIACFVAGDAVFAASAHALGGVPVPSWADALYLAGYPLIAAGLLRLLRGAAPAAGRGAAVDAAVVAAAAGVLVWVLLAGPAANSATGFAATLVAVAYPAGDLALLAVAARLDFAVGWRGAPGRLLAVAVGAMLAADVAYAFAQSAGAYQPGGLLDALWLLSYVAFGAAALHPDAANLGRPALSSSGPPRRRIAALAAAALVGPALVAAGAVGRGLADAAVVGIATAALVLLAVARVAALAGELDRALARSRRSEERLALALAAAGMAAWDWDAAGGMEAPLRSRGLRALLGVEDPVPRTTPAALLDRVHPADRPALEEAARRAWEAGGAYEVEYRAIGDKGRVRWLRDRGKAIPGRILGVTQDVTEQRRAAEELRSAKAAAEEADRLKGAFLRTMSHELRTPLTSVVGYADLLHGILEARGMAEEVEDAAQLRRGATRVLALVNDLLDLARIDAGALALVMERVDLAAAADDVRAELAPQAAAKGLALTVDVPGDLSVRADRGRLHQVLLNLAGNAVKFTEAGSVAISARGTGDVVEVSVADTGIGIPQEALPHVFDEFRQVDDTTARRYGGTGLGLAIARKLVEAHGGTIRAESSFGVGSTFTVTLPAP